MSDQRLEFRGVAAEPRVLGDQTPADPFAMLTDWLPADDDPARPLAQLATVDAGGAPHLRSLLLSRWDEDGFCMHTDAGSAKCAELRAESRVAALLVWPDRARQLVVEGVAHELGRDEAADAYRRRSDYLRQLAWENTTENAQRPAAERERSWARTDPESLTAPPPSWTGYRIVADRLVFWAGSSTMPSRRVEYRRDGPGWSHGFLPG